MFNKFLGGLSSGNGSGGGGDALPTVENRVMFDELEATADFESQLGPPPAGLITQTQGDAPTAGVYSPGPPGGRGGNEPTPTPTPTSRHGGGQQPTGESAYSGIDSVIQKLGGKM
jgi:hypothetical protein